jgi:HPt (histidine-containing phosphotransfer) domain-containing protein
MRFLAQLQMDMGEMPVLANRQFDQFSQPKGESCASFDRDHFERQTFGDQGLQKEIIALFLAQIADSRVNLASPMTNSSWRFLTHTLKGAASAVGATQFAVLAAQWELAGSPREEEERLALVQVFDVELKAFSHAVSSYLE